MTSLLSDKYLPTDAWGWSQYKDYFSAFRAIFHCLAISLENMGSSVVERVGVIVKRVGGRSRIGNDFHWSQPGNDVCM